MILDKHINEITWEDVTDFCQEKIPEGSFLDYKEDFPNKLQNTVTAMANTFGGIILIGIEETDDNKPVFPIKGIPFVRGLSERVTNVLLTNSSPPVFPEIGVVLNSAGDKAVLVIRVHQSHETPHAVAQKTRVYIRTGDVNNPEELATIDEIQWLSESREKSTSLRHSLTENALSRYQVFYDRVLDNIARQGGEIEESKNGILSLLTSPLYPKDPFLTPPELFEILREFRVPDYYLTDTVFPPTDMLSGTAVGTLVNDGVIQVRYTLRGDRVMYTEIGTHGVFFYRQPLRRKVAIINDDERTLLYASEMITRIDEFIDSATKYYKRLGYWGLISFKMWLSNISEVGLSLDWYESSFPYDEPIGFSPDEESNFQNVVLSSELEDNKTAIVLDVAKYFAWTFGINFVEGNLEHFWSKVKN